MSRWASNTTCLHLKGSKTAQKGAKRACHGALGPRHVALDLQRDVALAQRVQNCLKEGEKSAPRRIGPPPCRVGPPTRRGSASKAPKQPKREQEERATSYWASNAKCLQPKGTKSPKKRVKRVRHVALGVRHVALGLQRDVAPAQRVQNCLKEGEKSAPRRIGPPPCRVGLPTRRGSSPKSPKQPKREQKERVTSYWPPRHVALGLQHDVAPQLQTPSYCDRHR